MAVLEIFKCSLCGSCCRNVTRWEKLKPQIQDALGINIEFPFTSINGVCPMLSDDNTCSIYEKRPNCCRTDYIYGLLKLRYSMSIDDFLSLQMQACHLNRDSQK